LPPKSSCIYTRTWRIYVDLGGNMVKSTCLMTSSSSQYHHRAIKRSNRTSTPRCIVTRVVRAWRGRITEFLTIRYLEARWCWLGWIGWIRVVRVVRGGFGWCWWLCVHRRILTSISSAFNSQFAVDL